MSDAESFKYNPEEMTELYTLYKSDLDYIKVLKQNANNKYLLNNGGSITVAWADITGKPTTFTPPVATEATIGGVKMVETQADSAATDIETLVSDFNSLLAKLKAAGIMA